MRSSSIDHAARLATAHDCVFAYGQRVKDESWGWSSGQGQFLAVRYLDPVAAVDTAPIVVTPLDYALYKQTTLTSARVANISDEASDFDAFLAFAAACLEFIGDMRSNTSI